MEGLCIDCIDQQAEMVPISLGSPVSSLLSSFYVIQ